AEGLPRRGPHPVRPSRGEGPGCGSLVPALSLNQRMASAYNLVRLPRMRLAPLLVLLSAAASAQTAYWASADDKTAVWMISQERRWAESACDGNDVVQTLLADDFQGTSPSGKRYSKPTEREKPSARDCKLGEVKIRFFGDNLAIAYGTESR